MGTVYVKIHQRKRGSKYRKMLTTEQSVFPDFAESVFSTSPYTPGAMLEEGEWFAVENATSKQYAIDLFQHNFESVDFDSLDRSDFGNIDFIFVRSRNAMFFQKVSKAKLVSKKSIGCFGEDFSFRGDRKEIVINDLPDAIYRNDNDTLYFRRLESVTGIFKGIDLLYKEATLEETADFLAEDFIALQDDYAAEMVKTANRKRIALAQCTLSNLEPEEKIHIFHYIQEYCPSLAQNNEKFNIGTEDDLKLLLYGIEQRFYTTPVGGEKRIANSVIALAQ